MKLKQYVRYQIDFKSGWVKTCSILMGLCFFACLVYYFAVTTMRDVGIVELIAAILLGIVISGAYVVCVSCIRLNAPGLYAILGAAQCLLIIILNCMSVDAVRILLSILWYGFAAVVLLATAGGYLPGRLLAGLMFFIPLAVRIVFYDLGKLSFILWFKEIPILCTLAAIGCLAMGFKPSNRTRQ